MFQSTRRSFAAENASHSEKGTQAFLSVVVDALAQTEGMPSLSKCSTASMRRRSPSHRRHIGLPLAVLACLFLVLPSCSRTDAFQTKVALPRCRGTLRALALNPWGKVADKVSRGANKLILKTTNASQVLYLDGLTARLVDAKDLPAKAVGSVRVVAVSDTHGKHRFLPIPYDCDVLLHCGDLLQGFGPAGDLGSALPALYDFRGWLRSVPAKHKVFIAGNHDGILEKMGDQRVREMFQKDGNPYSIHYLRDSGIQLEGLNIYGSPWSPERGTGNEAFQQGQTASQQVAAISGGGGPIDIDILMTHAMCTSWEPLILESGVRCWVHGHWHSSHGQAKECGKGCISVNVASNDRMYLPKNPPVVVDIVARDESS